MCTSSRAGWYGACGCCCEHVLPCPRRDHQNHVLQRLQQQAGTEAGTDLRPLWKQFEHSWEPQEHVSAFVRHCWNNCYNYRCSGIETPCPIFSKSLFLSCIIAIAGFPITSSLS